MTGTNPAVARYKVERPLYEEFVKVVATKAEEACNAAAIPCRTQSRAKTMASFIKKVLRDKAAYEAIFDKGGVRVLPLYPDDRAAIAEVVHKTFQVTWVKDFAEASRPDQFGYRGLHFTVELTEADRASERPEIASLAAELQIHTPGESVWASVNHDLIYKTSLEIPPDVHRSLNRVSALLELVDSEMSGAREKILGLRGAEVARLLAALEKHFLPLRAQAYDARLSIIVLEALKPLVDINEFEHLFGEFVANNQAKLNHVFSQNEEEEEERHILLSQPESLLLFFLARDHMPELEKNWPGSLPQEMLSDLFEVWVP